MNIQSCTLAFCDRMFTRERNLSRDAELVVRSIRPIPLISRIPIALPDGTNPRNRFSTVDREDSVRTGGRQRPVKIARIKTALTFSLRVEGKQSRRGSRHFQFPTLCGLSLAARRKERRATEPSRTARRSDVLPTRERIRD